MKLFLQILLFLLVWFTNQANATPVFIKDPLPNYELTVLKTENVKEESLVKIGEQNFERSDIENKNQFSSILNGKLWVSYATRKILQIADYK